MVLKILNVNVVGRKTGSAQYDLIKNQINIQIVGLIIPRMHREYLTGHLILFRTYCKFPNNRRMLVSLA